MMRFKEKLAFIAHGGILVAIGHLLSSAFYPAAVAQSGRLDMKRLDEDIRLEQLEALRLQNQRLKQELATGDSPAARLREIEEKSRFDRAILDDLISKVTFQHFRAWASHLETLPDTDAYKREIQRLVYEGRLGIIQTTKNAPNR